MLNAPVGAVPVAAMVTCCSLPGASVNVAGDVVTPPGRFPADTFTFAENPLRADMETVAIWLPLSPRVRLAGVAETEKSALGVDTGVEWDIPEGPHPATKTINVRKTE